MQDSFASLMQFSFYDNDENYIHSTDVRVINNITYGKPIIVGKTIGFEENELLIVFIAIECYSSLDNPEPNELHMGESYPHSGQILIKCTPIYPEKCTIFTTEYRQKNNI